MRVTSWNLLHGMAIPPDPTVDAVAVLEAQILKLKSDVIGVQEVDYFLERSGNHNQVGNIATVMKANERERMEKLVHFMARPVIAEDSLPYFSAVQL